MKREILVQQAHIHRCGEEVVESVETVVFSDAAFPGLVIGRALMGGWRSEIVQNGRWQVIHTRSGLVISSYYEQRPFAAEAARRLALLTDWTQDAEALRAWAKTGDVIDQIRKATQ